MIQFIRNQLPNALTCLNFGCGMMGIILLGEKKLEALGQVEILLVIAGLADFLDGLLARALGSSSAIGKDLDSLADATTFGILPSVAVYYAFKAHAGQPELPDLVYYFPLIIGIFSIIRLARFNNDTRQTEDFIGLPTPANAFFLIFSLGLLESHPVDLFQGPAFYCLLSLGSAVSLVMPVRLLALKFKDLSIQNNLARIGLIVVTLASLLIFGKLAIPFLFGLYVLTSLVHFSLTRHERI